MTRLWTSAALVLLFLLSGELLAAAQPVGAVVRHQGAVFAFGPIGSRRLYKGRTVFAGDTLVTSRNARLEIHFRSGAQITLGANTRFAVQQVDTPGADGSASSFFSLVKGVFRALAKLRSADDRFEVRTRLATIGIRGTEFWGGFYFDANKLDVTMLEGDGVYVRNNAGEVSLDTPGSGTTVSANQKPGQAKTWPASKRQSAIDSVAW